MSLWRADGRDPLPTTWMKLLTSNGRHRGVTRCKSLGLRRQQMSTFVHIVPRAVCRSQSSHISEIRPSRSCRCLESEPQPCRYFHYRTRILAVALKARNKYLVNAWRSRFRHNRLVLSTPILRIRLSQIVYVVGTPHVIDATIYEFVLVTVSGTWINKKLHGNGDMEV